MSCCFALDHGMRKAKAMPPSQLVPDRGKAMVNEGADPPP
jgi:hypothetical protein